MKVSFVSLLTLASLALAAAPSTAQGSDDCSSAEPIAGPGTYAFDNANATADGLPDASCNPNQIEHDVWFAWTASSSGTVIVSTCGLTSIDTMLAAYDGAGCPTGPPLDCTDDDCATQSRIAFTATAGQVYSLRVGTWTNAAGGAGQFEIASFAPPPGDDCAAAIPIFGPGTYPFDNQGANTDGNADVLCTSRGGQIDNDVWFAWTSTMDGQATV